MKMGGQVNINIVRLAPDLARDLQWSDHSQFLRGDGDSRTIHQDGVAELIRYIKPATRNVLNIIGRSGRVEQLAHVYAIR